MQYQQGGPGWSQPPTWGPRISLDVLREAWDWFMYQPGLWIAMTAVFVAVSFVAGLASYAVPVVGQVVAMVLSAVLSAGPQAAALKQVRGGVVVVNDLFAGFTGRNFPNVLLAGLLVSMIVSAGLACCIVPGVIAAALLMFTNLLVMDRQVRAVDALTMSFHIIKTQLGPAVLLVVVCGLISMAGAMLCCVGFLATVPIVTFAVSLTYRNVVG